MTANRLCLLAAAWMVLLANSSFWHLLLKAQGTSGRTLLFAASMFAALLGLTLLLLRLLSPGRSLRVSLSLLLLLAACASWFMDTYGVALDTEMLRNVWQTNPAEAGEFIGWPLLWRLLWQAALPIAVVWIVPLPHSDWLRSLRDYALGAVAGLLLLCAAVLPMYASHVSYFRNQHGARHLIVPANVVLGSMTLLQGSLHREIPFVQVGVDAQRGRPPAGKPLLLVVVVGETARAANFSLGGYARATNPLLQQRDVYYFSNAYSCGTSTAVSVPCMFSDLPRKEFDLSKAGRRDSVLDILQRAGLAVTWIDNQSGCKKVCDRIPQEAVATYHPASCSNGECLDEALLHALDAKLPAIDRDAVLLLHQMGSHGPAYYRRVPPQMAVFQPTCATERIETCSDRQIVNAYDNSIVYTDYVLAGLIDRLAADQHLDSVLLYVSDHGESLGENGLYLHGQPFLIAPAVQKHVPMLLWFSAGALPRLRIDTACLRNRLALPVSHDNLAHTLLGLADVTTSARRAELDSLQPCRL
ncbi:MAG: phosphoethanolamine--lipid A transferase [Steroidobacteraceae bacterium]